MPLVMISVMMEKMRPIIKLLWVRQHLSYTVYVQSGYYVHLCTAGNTPGLHCSLPPTTILLTSVGQEYETSGLRIKIPDGAVKESVETTLTVAVVIATVPCTYPEDIKQISPVFMLHPNKKVDLKKPIEITIPHFLHGSVGSDSIEGHIGVLKASEKNSKTGSQYKFNKQSDCKVHLGVNKEGEGFATFKVQHFCLFQLYSDTTVKEIAMKAAYCLCRLEPRAERYPRVYYYVLTYKMRLFIQVR